MRADPSGFLRRSQVVILLGLLMIGAGAVSEYFWDTLTKTQTNNADPTVALLLLVPTLLVAYLTREGDHDILSSLLRMPRFLVASTGLVTLVAAAGLVVGVHGDALFWLWAGSATWLAIVLGWLATINWRARGDIATIRDTQGSTVEDVLTVIGEDG
jgi:peptidoglycan/LPS O-acetylase OafA/YrhL